MIKASCLITNSEVEWIFIVLLFVVDVDFLKLLTRRYATL